MLIAGFVVVDKFFYLSFNQRYKSMEKIKDLRFVYHKFSSQIWERK